MRTERSTKNKVADISTSARAAANKDKKKIDTSASARISMLISLVKGIPENIKGIYRAATVSLPYYLPSVFLIAMACALLVAPTFFLGLCAGLLLYMGVVGVYMARRMRTLIAKFTEVIRHVETRVYLHNRAEASGWEEQEIDPKQGLDKKTVLH